MAHGLLPFLVCLKQLQPLLPGLRLFEPQGGGRLGHLLPALLHQVPHAPAEQLAHRLDGGVIVRLGLQPDTGAVAPVHLEVEAGAELARGDILHRQRQTAGADVVKRGDQLQQPFGVHHGGVGAEPARAVLLVAPGHHHAGERFVSDADPGVGLAVLEQDVVVWLELLDEVVLEQQRVLLRLHRCIVKIGDMGHQRVGLAVQLVRRPEVLGHAAFQVLGLAYIDDGALRIEIAIDPRRVGQRGHLLLERHHKNK